MWEPGSTEPIDLNTLIDANAGWRLSQATGISDTNWVTGIGIYDGYKRQFLMQVPEPASVGLLILLSALLRRRCHLREQHNTRFTLSLSVVRTGVRMLASAMRTSLRDRRRPLSWCKRSRNRREIRGIPLDGNEKDLGLAFALCHVETKMTRCDSQRVVKVEARGIEPLSKTTSTQASTCLANDLISTRHRATCSLRRASAVFISSDDQRPT